MLHRVYEILLVASPYDAFILEEDGRLTEQILQEYLGLNFSYPPRVWEAYTGKKALEIVTKRKFDLILLMTRIADMSPVKLAEKIRKLYPRKPVVLLAYDESELKPFQPALQADPPLIDKAFVWSGHANVLLALIKYVEDTRNARRDILYGDVRAIIFIEDTPRYYSSILPLIYQEILYHTRSLVSKSLKTSTRLLHLRARPKILLASSYEEAKKYFDDYCNNIIGIISDIRFPKQGVMEKTAGLQFTEYVRTFEPAMPIVLQSSDKRREEEARQMGTEFLHKTSPTLLQDIRRFILNNFGFGDFVFRYPSGRKITSVSSLEEMVETLPKISAKSVAYHASSNHFSNWLAARGEFQLASIVRALKDDKNLSAQDRKKRLIKAMLDYTTEARPTGIVEFNRSIHPLSTHFMRIGHGSMGGKARGLAFFNSILQKENFEQRFPGIQIRIPKVLVVATDVFDRFMTDNQLWSVALSQKTDEAILKKFRKGKLPEDIQDLLHHLVEKIHFPLAVRSSSILEDSQYQPLSGLYATFMLPNSDPREEVRFHQLCNAIKSIYASMFFSEAKAFIDASIHRHEEEKMAVLIMELVGQRYGNRYYPTIAGTAQSINYYPVSYMKREEGVANIALGFGRTVVEGGQVLRFSPHYPQIIPQFFSIKATLESSQHKFYALTMNGKKDPTHGGEEGNLTSYSLQDAEEDGALKWVGSTLVADDNVIRDSLHYHGTRVVTFAPVLKYNQFPLADILKDLLRIGERSLGGPVELEFAVNLPRDRNRKPEFCLLQIKPMAISTIETETVETGVSGETVARSSIALGNGIIDGLDYIVLVHPHLFDTAKTNLIAREIETLNNLIPDKHGYILIGPGRWGTADPWLGIPVNWNQISKARVIVELGLEDLPIDPSFGSHFFQNVTSMRIGYLTISHKVPQDFFNYDWIRGQTAIRELTYASCYQLKRPVEVRINGEKGEGVVVRPPLPEEEIMDEEESTGI
ncbi:MAG: response regulator [Candidatus Neomarinimicrobiota bacterium]|nr:MAG: response regulator [Candidatus Neomarinimicrobiota bacterium]